MSTCRGQPQRAGGRWLRLLAAVVVVTLVGGLTTLASANAAVPPRDRVYASYLPTVHQVSAVYPELSEGTRQVLRYRGQGAGFSCWDWTQAFRAADGRWALYLMKDGTMPYFAGLEDPGVFVFKFHTRHQALAAFWLQMKFVRQCMGEQVRDGTVSLRWPVRVPLMGQGSIAYRVYETLPTTGGRRHTHELHASVLRGRYLVNIYNQAEEFRPAKANAVRLARITVNNIG